jgi:hypothetical protein
MEETAEEIDYRNIEWHSVAFRLVVCHADSPGRPSLLSGLKMRG